MAIEHVFDVVRMVEQVHRERPNAKADHVAVLSRAFQHQAKNVAPKTHEDFPPPNDRGGLEQFELCSSGLAPFVKTALRWRRRLTGQIGAMVEIALTRKHG